MNFWIKLSFCDTNLEHKSQILIWDFGKKFVSKFLHSRLRNYLDCYVRCL